MEKWNARLLGLEYNKMKEFCKIKKKYKELIQKSEKLIWDGSITIHKGKRNF